jgi:hypothetical protein
MDSSSTPEYVLTFLSAIAVQVLLIGAYGYLTQPGGPGSVFLPTHTIILLNELFLYVVVIALAVVFVEWQYMRQKKRKYDGDEFVKTKFENGFDRPP